MVDIGGAGGGTATGGGVGVVRSSSSSNIVSFVVLIHTPLIFSRIFLSLVELHPHLLLGLFLQYWC